MKGNGAILSSQRPLQPHFSGRWLVEADTAQGLLGAGSQQDLRDHWDRIAYFKTHPPFGTPEQGKQEAEDAFRRWDEVIAAMPEAAEFRYAYNQGVFSFHLPKSQEDNVPAINFIVARDITQQVLPTQTVVDRFVQDVIDLLHTQQEKQGQPFAHWFSDWIVRHLLKNKQPGPLGIQLTQRSPHGDSQA